MAKRKRLNPALYTDIPPAAPPAPEVKSMPPGGGAPSPAPVSPSGSQPQVQPHPRPLAGAGLSSPPIAQVAGEAATAAALMEVTEMLETARAEGRMIQRLNLDSIDQDHLVRDRMESDAEEMAVLVESLRARGQQTPIEVVAIGDRFGLISGWRRLTALRRLHAETGEARFATALAILRRPEGASDAYVAMVEENEIRVGLSYFERARIVDRSVAQGVFDDDSEALRTLFASASRAKRSKIGSFLSVVRRLEPHLRFPVSLNERLGLRLSRALEDRGFAHQVAQALDRADRPDAEAERALLTRLLDAGETPRAAAGKLPESAAKGPVSPPAGAARVMSPRPGLTLRLRGEGGSRRCELTGPALDDDLLRDLEAWLKAR